MGDNSGFGSTRPGGFGAGLWKQAQQVRLQPDGTLEAPVQANGEDGIVVGDPPLQVFPTGGAAKKPGLLTRLRAFLRSR